MRRLPRMDRDSEHQEREEQTRSEDSLLSMCQGLNLPFRSLREVSGAPSRSAAGRRTLAIHVPVVRAPERREITGLATPLAGARTPDGAGFECPQHPADSSIQSGARRDADAPDHLSYQYLGLTPDHMPRQRGSRRALGYRLPRLIHDARVTRYGTTSRPTISGV
jgi:hypothetical protein